MSYDGLTRVMVRRRALQRSSEVRLEQSDGQSRRLEFDGIPHTLLRCVVAQAPLAPHCATRSVRRKSSAKPGSPTFLTSTTAPSMCRYHWFKASGAPASCSSATPHRIRALTVLLPCG